MQIVVLGMHRSGTSLVTRLINMMGAYVGEKGDLLEPTEANPRGYWERRDIFDLNRFVLARTAGTWPLGTEFGALEYSPELMSAEDLSAFKSKARRIISILDQYADWVIKDPRLCLTFPLWRPLLEKPVCVHVYRHPIGVAQSLRGRDGFPLNYGVALWELYNLRSQEAASGLPAVFVNVDEFMKEPFEAAYRLYRDLNAAGCRSLNAPEPQVVEAFIEQRLFKYASLNSEGAGVLNGSQLKLYAWLNGDRDTNINLGLSSGAEENLRLYEELSRIRSQTASRAHDASPLKVPSDGAEEEQGHSVGKLGENNRIKQEAEAVALGHRLQISQEQLRQARVAGQQLARLFEQMSGDIDSVFDSLTWKTGNRLANLARWLMRRKPEPGARDHIHQLVEKYSRWKRTGTLRVDLDAHEISPWTALRFRFLEKKRFRILAVVARRADRQPSSSAYVRLILPLGHETVSRQLAFSTCFIEELDSVRADLLVVQRNAVGTEEGVQQVLAYCRARDIPLVYELDDDLLVSVAHGDLKKAYSRQVIQAMARLAAAADLVVTSTESLQEVARRHNPNVALVENGLDEALWLDRADDTYREPESGGEGDPLRILYMGTRTHDKDLAIVAEACHRLERMYEGQVLFEVIGGNAKGGPGFGEVVEGPGKDDDDLYPNFVRWLRQNNRWSIGIAPLADTPFNQCKSYLKFLDYAALGLAPVCSDTLPYRSVVEDGFNGLLVENSTDAWYVALRRLIDDPALRRRLASNAFQTLIADHLLQNKAPALAALLENQRRGEPGPSRRFDEKLLPPVDDDEFEESAYLSQNPDVADAVATGQVRSPADHWERSGRSSVRDGSRPYVPGLLLRPGGLWDLTENQRAKLASQIDQWPRKPLISVVMPVYNVDRKWLESAVDSIRAQVYPHWELCIADDCSTRTETVEYLEQLVDERIRIVRLAKNSGISEASNAALGLASGEYVALVDHDDELTVDALFQVAKAINEDDPDLIYSDEDKLSIDNYTVEPHHKPVYSPDLLLSVNYISHLGVYRKRLVDGLGGFRKGFEGAQDYDLVLRVTSGTTKIHHIPHVLYHWRKVPGSTAAEFDSKNYAWENGRLALEDTLKQRGIDGTAELGRFPGTYRVRRRIQDQPLVSIIIPFKDKPELLEKCLDSILERTSHGKFEILGISNNSSEERTSQVMEDYSARDSRVRFIRYDVPFNYSRINNYGVAQTSGQHLLFLNNDIEILSSEWLEALLEHSQRPEVGAVGGRLLYSDGTVQHAGIVMGIGGVAGHVHKHLPAERPGYFGRAWVTQNVSAVTGACLMVKRTLFEDLGGLNENELKIAFNDVDFCLRLLEKGFLNVYTPYCEAYHHESVSRGAEDTWEKQQRFAGEREYMKRRHARVLAGGDPYYNPHLSHCHEDFSVVTEILAGRGI